MALLVARAILVAVDRYRESYAVIQLFALQLLGRCDDAFWQYAYALRRTLTAEILVANDDFDRQLPSLYPASHEDERASLQISYHRFLAALPASGGGGGPEPHALLPVREMVLEFMATQLLGRSELRYKKWLKVYWGGRRGRAALMNKGRLALLRPVAQHGHLRAALISNLLAGAVPLLLTAPPPPA